MCVFPFPLLLLSISAGENVILLLKLLQLLNLLLILRNGILCLKNSVFQPAVVIIFFTFYFFLEFLEVLS